MCFAVMLPKFDEFEFDGGHLGRCLDVTLSSVGACSSCSPVKKTNIDGKLVSRNFSTMLGQ
jgi:hypothetical protein